MDSAAARTKLLTSPAEFLKYYPINCAGGVAPNQNAANLQQFNINKRDGDMPPIQGAVTGHLGATRPGLFGHQREISSWLIQPGLSVNGATILSAHVVPMVNYDAVDVGILDLQGDVSAMPYFLLDASGDGLMFTGQLSGCCFCWSTHGADLWTTHVRPRTGIAAIALQNRLITGGRFAAAPTDPLRTFGRSEYPGHANVIGVRRAGSWSLYAQLSMDVFATLAGAFKIHPGPITRL
ncbi:hypothetical protein KZX46_15005 [Polymorphobacter sp. PAMC 29334]|uniref:hypothetical protein n=1 Tax=Polymorphobacter sp. PAMC 29334 TaxID=2862331 RepID=UPI001C742FA8|nr:hypothetical protein [Polymorphobacter sp. PAMC 29334]QYE34093.1 hypothetical protein KZX46_15005 [Polymorphobacter sp. PAMC 29334]